MPVCRTSSWTDLLPHVHSVSACPLTWIWQAAGCEGVALIAHGVRVNGSTRKETEDTQEDSMSSLVLLVPAFWVSEMSATS